MGSGGKDLKRSLRCMKRVHMIVFASLLVLVVVAPFWVLPICILISIVRVVELGLLSRQSGDVECECCCCGANTSDAKNGNLTAEQECCSCCKGSGVCAPSCADCCDPPKGCGCQEGCCCCSSNGTKATDDCKCCCCGATTAQSRDGTLTDVQACCGCCKGTGACSDACASCCGNSGCGCSCSKGTGKCCYEVESCGNSCSLKGRGQKHVVLARNEVYCGVPLQVV